jgi:hypothetical protein
MSKGGSMRKRIIIGGSIAVVVAASIAVSLMLLGASAAANLYYVDGHLAYIRVNAETNVGYGGGSNYVNADVIVKMRERPDDRFVFQLRSGGNAMVQEAMLYLLTVAYEHDYLVRIEYMDEGRSTHFIRDIVVRERD